MRNIEGGRKQREREREGRKGERQRKGKQGQPSQGWSGRLMCGVLWSVFMGLFLSQIILPIASQGALG